MMKYCIHMALVLIGLTHWNSSAQSISAGYSHSAVLCSDSTVWISGSNALGQKIGLSNSPSSVFEATNLNCQAVVSGGNHLLGLSNDYQVWSWGYNNFGQTGSGSNNQADSLITVGGLTNIIQLAAGESNTFAVKNNGSLWAWGYNQYGQLGDGTKTPKSSPQLIFSEGVKQVSASMSHTLALMNDSTVYAWGMNLYGEIAQPLPTKYTVNPTKITVLTNVVKVVAGMHFSMVLKDDGSLWSWGLNESGNLGLGHFNTELTPTQVAGISNVKDVAVGQSHVLAITEDGSLYSWGLNLYSQVGDGSWSNQNAPIQLPMDSVSTVATGPYHSLIARENGDVYAWGYNEQGQLGLGNTSTAPTPQLVSIGCSVNQIEPICPTEATILTSDTTVCLGDTASFTATIDTANTNNWYLGTAALGDQDEVKLVFDSTGSKEILLVVNPNGCSDTARTNLNIVDVPNASIVDPNALCINDNPTALQTADTTGSWTGATNDGTINPSQLGVGEHKVYYFVQNDGCGRTDSSSIVILPTPTAGFIWNLPNDSTVAFTNEASDITSTTWLFGDGNSSTENEPTHVYDSSGTYFITQIVESGCGTDTIMDTVLIVLPKTSGVESHIIPEYIRVYPNPVATKLFIDWNKETELIEAVTLFNALGEQMEGVNQVSRQQRSIEVDVSKLPNGLYFINITSNAEVNSIPIVVSH